MTKNIAVISHVMQIIVQNLKKKLYQETSISKCYVNVQWYFVYLAYMYKRPTEELQC